MCPPDPVVSDHVLPQYMCVGGHKVVKGEQLFLFSTLALWLDTEGEAEDRPFNSFCSFLLSAILITFTCSYLTVLYSWHSLYQSLLTNCFNLYYLLYIRCLLDRHFCLWLDCNVENVSPLIVFTYLINRPCVKYHPCYKMQLTFKHICIVQKYERGLRKWNWKAYDQYVHYSLVCCKGISFSFVIYSTYLIKHAC